MSATETPIMQMLVARLDRIDERIETNRQENAREHTNITAKLETANSLRIDIAQLHSEVKTLNEKLVEIKNRPEKVMSMGALAISILTGVKLIWSELR